MEVEGVEAKWASAVQTVWEAEVAVSRPLGDSTPNDGVLNYLLRVFSPVFTDEAVLNIGNLPRKIDASASPCPS